MKKIVCICIGLFMVAVPAYASIVYNQKPVPKFFKQEQSLDSDFFSEHLWAQGERVIRFDDLFRFITFRERKSRDVLPDGSVPDSAFFENRLTTTIKTPADVEKGNITTVPPPDATWTLFKAKSDGRSAGFFAQDSTGEKYLLKLDNQAYPEMNSSAEIICARLFYALGYNVPEYSIVYFTIDQLQIPDGIQYVDETGFKKPLTHEALRTILRTSSLNQNRQYRASASKIVPGKIIGPMSFSGRRIHDPQDTILHEDRRELRGLRVFSSWLNHFDVRRGNTFDALVVNEKGWYIKHYLFDFGSCLGAFIGSGKTPEQGEEYIITPSAIMKSLLTLGFYKRPWVRHGVVYPQTGYFTNEGFDPATWRPQIPNYAFQDMTVADAQWAAALLKKITDAMVIAAVDAGDITNEKARQDLIQKLIERRDIIINYWQSKS